jgi:hypothetical protein
LAGLLTLALIQIDWKLFGDKYQPPSSVTRLKIGLLAGILVYGSLTWLPKEMVHYRVGLDMDEPIMRGTPW